LEGFNDANADTEVISISELTAAEVNIFDIVQLGEVLGQGKYGMVHKGILLSTGENVAVKKICKADLSEKDMLCLKVVFFFSSYIA
jgi:serine/threonine protein kinase